MRSTVETLIEPSGARVSSGSEPPSISPSSFARYTRTDATAISTGQPTSSGWLTLCRSELACASFSSRRRGHSGCLSTSRKSTQASIGQTYWGATRCCALLVSATSSAQSAKARASRSVLEGHRLLVLLLEVAVGIAAVAGLGVAVVALLAELDRTVATLALALQEVELDEATGERPLRPRAPIGRASPDVALLVEFDLAREVDGGGEREDGPLLGGRVEADQCVGIRAGHPDVARGAVDGERVRQLEAGGLGGQRVDLPLLRLGIEAAEVRGRVARHPDHVVRPHVQAARPLHRRLPGLDRARVGIDHADRVGEQLRPPHALVGS